MRNNEQNKILAMLEQASRRYCGCDFSFTVTPYPAENRYHVGVEILTSNSIRGREDFTRFFMDVSKIVKTDRLTFHSEDILKSYRKPFFRIIGYSFEMIYNNPGET